MIDDKVMWMSDCHYNDYKSFDMNINNPTPTPPPTYVPTDLPTYYPITYPPFHPPTYLLCQPTYLPTYLLFPIFYNLPISYLSSYHLLPTS
jgi:hypothetical protein